MVPNALSQCRSTWTVATAFALVTTIVLGACAETGRFRRTGVKRVTHAAGAPTARPGAPVGHELAGFLHGRTGAYLTVADAASRVEVRVADLPGLLYRITTPVESGLAPRVTGQVGRVRVGLRPTGADGPDNVTIELNRVVRWDIRLPAGAGEEHLDLDGGRIARLELGAAGLVDVRLPHPTGTVPVTLTDGAGTVEITTPRATPVRVRLRGGGGPASTGWTANDGNPPGTVITSPGWTVAPNRYAVDARSDIGALTIR
jgi:hypothetical protein